MLYEEKGFLDIKINTSTAHFSVVMADEDGAEAEHAAVGIKSGEKGSDKNYYWWNNSTEKFSGTISYKVEKGTYFVRISRGNNSGGNGKLTVTA